MRPNIEHIVVIGIGGGASYLIPPLLKSFDYDTLSFFDGDILEERNLDRQLFKESLIGMNKAEAMKKLYKIKRCKVYPQYITQGSLEVAYLCQGWKDLETVFLVCVDNHRARNDVLDFLELNKEKDMCAIFLANESFTAQSYIHYPRHGTEDPRERYPEIRTSTEGDRISCAGEETIVKTPQLPIGNMTSAALALNLLWQWKSGKLSDTKGLPIEFQTTYGKMETLVKR